jgi:hypothetical protein
MKTIAIAAAVLALCATTAFAQTDKAGNIGVAHPWAAATSETNSPTVPFT